MVVGNAVVVVVEVVVVVVVVVVDVVIASVVVVVVVSSSVNVASLLTVLGLVVELTSIGVLAEFILSEFVFTISRLH